MPNPSASDSARRGSLAPVVITIDGPAGAGKSTVAKRLASRLGLLYLDTGATYRALAFEALRLGVDPMDEAGVAKLSRSIRILLRRSSDGIRVLLDGEDVTETIRTERVTEAAAAIAQHPRVRAEMVRLQRRLAKSGRVIAEGRDTGSVVFPRAPYKFFLTARTTIRARRRRSEMRAAQGKPPRLEVIARQLRRRDHLDRTRSVGPLVKPPDAIVLDTTALSVQEVVARMLQHLPH
jgi:cytidylate kinase